MELERGATRIFSCPICQVDTPHTIRSRRGEVYAVVCTNCSSGSLVRADELRLFQARWEEELRQILDHLGNGPDSRRDET